eukprot:scaffold8110_cov403-Prasinococcus_capsulatus_cf.AAC.6
MATFSLRIAVDELGDAGVDNGIRRYCEHHTQEGFIIDKERLAGLQTQMFTQRRVDAHAKNEDRVHDLEFGIARIKEEIGEQSIFRSIGHTPSDAKAEHGVRAVVRGTSDYEDEDRSTMLRQSSKMKSRPHTLPADGLGHSELMSEMTGHEDDAISTQNAETMGEGRYVRGHLEGQEGIEGTEDTVEENWSSVF